jgi:hypothetical protein
LRPYIKVKESATKVCFKHCGRALSLLQVLDLLLPIAPIKQQQQQPPTSSPASQYHSTHEEDIDHQRFVAKIGRLSVSGEQINSVDVGTNMSV